MPSMILNNPFASGPQIILNGNPWSGLLRKPEGQIDFLWVSSGGLCYVGMSGVMTQNSGSMFLSGGANSGMLDGMAIPPGGRYSIPRLGMMVSGVFSIYANCDVAASGTGRLYFNVF